MVCSENCAISPNDFTTALTRRSGRLVGLSSARILTAKCQTHLLPLFRRTPNAFHHSFHGPSLSFTSASCAAFHVSPSDTLVRFSDPGCLGSAVSPGRRAGRE